MMTTQLARLGVQLLPAFFAWRARGSLWPDFPPTAQTWARSIRPARKCGCGASAARCDHEDDAANIVMIIAAGDAI